MHCVFSIPSEVNAFIIQKESVPPVSYDQAYIVQLSSPKSKLEAANAEIKALQCEVERLKAKQFCLDRFSSDSRLKKNFNYTDYITFVSVFTSLQPNASTLIRWTHMHRHSSNMDQIKNKQNQIRCEICLKNLNCHFIRRRIPEPAKHQGLKKECPVMFRLYFIFNL